MPHHQPPQTKEDAEALLHRAGELSAELASCEAQLERQIARVARKPRAELRRRVNELSHIGALLYAYWRTKGRKETDTKSLVLVSGSLNARDISEIVITEEDAAIALLRQRGFDELIDTVETVSKKRLTDEALRLLRRERLVKRARRSVFYARPKEGPYFLDRDPKRTPRVAIRPKEKKKK